MSLRKRVTLIVLACFLMLTLLLVIEGSRRLVAMEARLEATQLQMLAVSWSGFAATERQRLEGHFDAFRRAPAATASVSAGRISGLDQVNATLRADLRAVRMQVLRPDGTLLYDSSGAEPAAPVFGPDRVAAIAARTAPLVGPVQTTAAPAGPGYVGGMNRPLRFSFAAPLLATSGVAGVVLLLSDIAPMLDEVAATLGTPVFLTDPEGRLLGASADPPPEILEAAIARNLQAGGVEYLEAGGLTYRSVTSGVATAIGGATLRLTALEDVTASAERREALAAMAFAALTSATVLFFAFLNWSLRTAFRPLEAIIQALAALTEGRRDIIVPQPVRADEIGRLTGTFETFRQGMEARSRLGRLNQELETAAGIQAQCLPRTFPNVPGLCFAADMRPMREVGGDFYDVFALPDGRVGLVIADVSDKGMGAALFMAVARTVVRATAPTSPDAATCVTRVNDYLCTDNEAMLFVTLIYAVLDPRTGALDMCNAGHNPALLIGPDGAPSFLAPEPQPALGILDDWTYTGGGTVLPRGGRLFLYTDGVTEAMTEAGAEFGEDQLQAAIPATGTAEDTLRSVLAAVDDFLGGGALSDDITALAVARDLHQGARPWFSRSDRRSP